MKIFEEIGGIIGLVGGLIGIIGVLAFILAYLKGSTAKNTIDIQNQNIQALFDKQKIQENEIQDLKLHNAKLQGEVDTFKSVPLVQIAKNQADTTKLIKVIADNQQLIMQELKITARQDREEQ